MAILALNSLTSSRCFCLSRCVLVGVVGGSEAGGETLRHFTIDPRGHRNLVRNQLEQPDASTETSFIMNGGDAF